MEANDLELLSRAREGDERAFADLMRRHEARIFSLCYRMLGDRAEALDATQDTFINVFRRSEAFRGDSAFSTWVYRIGINVCKDALRKKARTPVPTEELEPAASGSSMEDAVDARTDVGRALAELPEEYREAVVMFDIGGIPYEEIAALTDSALGTVKSRISRGRKRLAELLEQPGSPQPSKDQR
ncbi:MAG: RNA polymerase sigma factor [Actinomycetota bacterium]